MKACRILCVLLLVLIVIALTTPTVMSQSGDVIYACYNKKTGNLRKVASASNCTSQELPISWNIAGPQGPPGPQGIKGDTGATGPAGPLNPYVTIYDQNTALGIDALLNNRLYGGNHNTASGYNALYSNLSGGYNTASGSFALASNVYGSANTASGTGALQMTTDGYRNTASGAWALGSNTTGYDNTANGMGALFHNTTGNLNTGIGFQAGVNVSRSSSNNIHVNNEGAFGDENTIRIGIVTSTEFYPNPHARTFVAGIYGAGITGSGLPVYVDDRGQLGITTSSRRFKEDIRDMSDTSAGLLRLRPVTFRYKPEYSKDDQSMQYGLIAEEVAAVYPDLVQYDKDGKAFSVKYHLLSSMLLNELQRQNEHIKSLEERLTALEALVDKPAASPGK